MLYSFRNTEKITIELTATVTPCPAVIDGTKASCGINSVVEQNLVLKAYQETFLSAFP